jgi:predicted NBD/HSP70 family sugar kinase
VVVVVGMVVVVCVVVVVGAVVVVAAVVVVVAAVVVVVVTGGGAAGAATTPVAAEVATVEPFLFEATTVTRLVAPTSGEASVSVCAVAPATAWQPPPRESQRSHW